MFKKNLAQFKRVRGVSASQKFKLNNEILLFSLKKEINHLVFSDDSVTLKKQTETCEAELKTLAPRLQQEEVKQVKELFFSKIKQAKERIVTKNQISTLDEKHVVPPLTKEKKFRS